MNNLVEENKPATLKEVYERLLIKVDKLNELREISRRLLLEFNDPYIIDDVAEDTSVRAAKDNNQEKPTLIDLFNKIDEHMENNISNVKENIVDVLNILR